MFKRRNYSRYQNKSKRSAYAKGKYPMTKGRIASRYTLVNTVQQVLSRNSELKYHDTAFSFGFTASNTGDANTCAVAQGSTDTTRIGDRLRIKSLEARWEFDDTATTLSQYSKQILRIVFVQWFPATTPGNSDIFSGTTIRSFYSHDNRQMFKVYYDKTFSVAGGTSKDLLTGHLMIYPKKNNQIQYQSGGTVGTNKFYVFVIAANYGTSVTSGISFQTRLRFTDS